MAVELRKANAAAHAQVAEAAEPYAVGELREVAHVLRNGQATNCFRVVAGSRVFAMHLSPARTLDRVESVLTAQARLEKGGVLCAHPVPSQTGAYSSTIPNGVVAMLDWLEGPTLTECDVPMPESIGRTAAQLHVVSENLTGPDAMIPTVPQFLASIRRCARPGLQSLEGGLCAWVEGVFDTIPTGLVGPNGLIHNDIHHRNIIVPPCNAPYLIDFGNCEHNFLMKDVGVASFYALQVAKRPDTRILGRLLRSYCEVRPLVQADVDQAITSLRLKAVEFLAWQVLRYVRSETELSTVASAREMALLVERIADMSRATDLLATVQGDN